jgi:hypothetical protein
MVEGTDHVAPALVDPEGQDARTMSPDAEVTILAATEEDETTAVFAVETLVQVDPAAVPYEQTPPVEPANRPFVKDPIEGRKMPVLPPQPYCPAVH